MDRFTSQQSFSAGSLLQQVVDAAPIAICATTADGKVTLWNAAAERLFGWTQDQVMGRFMPGIPGDHRDEFMKLRSRVASGGSVNGIQTRRLRRDGASFEARVWSAPLRDEHGTVAGMIVVTADNSRPAGKARTQVETAGEHGVALQAVGQLAAGIAHDFNNLLTGILGHAELLDGEDDDPEARKASLAAIRESAQYAVFLTRQLLAYASQQIFRPAIVDLVELIEEMRGRIEEQAGAHMSVSYELASSGTSRIDPGQMREALLNLVANASEACGETGNIVIRTRDGLVSEVLARTFDESVEPGSYVVITVEDDGAGIEPPIMEKIFQPFFTTKPRGKGTGLGLSTVYGIVRQSGGFVRVDSEPATRTRVSMYLPRTRPGETTG